MALYNLSQKGHNVNIFQSLNWWWGVQAASLFQGELHWHNDKKRHLALWPAFPDSGGNESLLEASLFAFCPQYNPEASSMWSGWGCIEVSLGGRWCCFQRQSWCMLIQLGRFWTHSYFCPSGGSQLDHHFRCFGLNAQKSSSVWPSLPCSFDDLDFHICLIVVLPSPFALLPHRCFSSPYLV